jgi:hypothetical protein
MDFKILHLIVFAACTKYNHALESLTIHLDLQNSKWDYDRSLGVKEFGGKPPFIYKWNQTGCTSSLLQNLFPGTDMVTVTDAN